MASYSRFFQVTSVIWALVSDGEQAYIFKYRKNEMVYDEKVYSIWRDTNSAPSSLHKEPPSLASRKAIVRNLVPAIAEKLQEALDEKAFDHLVIVTPRETMNALLDNLSEDVRTRLLANMPEGYTYDRNGVIFAFQKETTADPNVKAAPQGRDLPPCCMREEGSCATARIETYASDSEDEPFAPARRLNTIQ